MYVHSHTCTVTQTNPQTVLFDTDCQSTANGQWIGLMQQPIYALLMRADLDRANEKLSLFSQKHQVNGHHAYPVFIFPDPHFLFPVGILPPHSDSHTLVAGYRKEQYQDILEALEVMRFINSSTPTTQVYLRMFQLESQVLPRCSDTSPPVRRGTIRS